MWRCALAGLMCALVALAAGAQETDVDLLYREIVDKSYPLAFDEARCGARLRLALRRLDSGSDFDAVLAKADVQALRDDRCVEKHFELKPSTDADAIVECPSLASLTMPGSVERISARVGRITISTFHWYPSTCPQWRLVNGLLAEYFVERVSELQGLQWILDLRNNRGGHVQTVQAAFSRLFAPTRDATLAIEVSRGEQVRVRKATSRGYIGCPAVVLINGSTASAAEMLAGALKYLCAGKTIIVGLRSYGKGVESSTHDWPVRLTLVDTEFFAGSGRTRIKIHGVGIEPDIEVPSFKPVPFALRYEFSSLPSAALDAALDMATVVASRVAIPLPRPAPMAQAGK